MLERRYDSFVGHEGDDERTHKGEIASRRDCGVFVGRDSRSANKSGGS